MGLGFLAPWFFGGALLLVIPWLVHQVRKPERKPVRFSSLMFVPDIRRDEVQRRKIQHPLLMLLRMLLLLLLALAFARPYKEVPAAAASVSRPLTRNVILFDISMSMREQGRFEEARGAARKLLAEMGRDDRVGVIDFAALPRTTAPLGDPEHPEIGTVERARAAIAAAQPTWESTAYLPALESAENMLKPFEGSQNADRTRLIVHLITDFQQTGMPEEAPAWKLPANIELHAIEIGKPGEGAAGATDLAIDELKQHQLRIRAKIKNWSMPDAKPLAVDLYAAGQRVEGKTATVKAGNATQTIFTMPWNGSQALEGDIEVAGSKTWFAWNPQQKHRVVLIADAATTLTTQTQTPAPPQNVWSGAKFIQLAIPPGADVPWTLRTVSPSAAPGVLARADDPPEIVILGQPESLGVETARELAAYLQRGGSVLAMLNGRLKGAEDGGFLEGLGVTPAGAHYARASDSVFATLAWVDLDHRIFAPFRGAQYNDFSPIHFYNYEQVSLAAPPAGETPRVLAKFDDDQPAIVEVAAGKGRLIVWAAGLDPDWTNLPKKATFLPLLQETLSYMTRAAQKTFAHRVGDSIANVPDSLSDRGPVQVQLPGQTDWKPFDPAVSLTLSEPGLLRWKAAGDATGRRAAAQTDAVNVDPRENDPLRIPVSEFRLRLCAAAPRDGVDPEKLAAEPGLLDAPLVKREYGHPFIGMLLALLLLESVYAVTLAVADNRKAEAQ